MEQPREAQLCVPVSFLRTDYSLDDDCPLACGQTRPQRMRPPLQILGQKGGRGFSIGWEHTLII